MKILFVQQRPIMKSKTVINEVSLRNKMVKHWDPPVRMILKLPLVSNFRLLRNSTRVMNEENSKGEFSGWGVWDSKAPKNIEQRQRKESTLWGVGYGPCSSESSRVHEAIATSLQDGFLAFERMMSWNSSKRIIHLIFLSWNVAFLPNSILFYLSTSRWLLNIEIFDTSCHWPEIRLTFFVHAWGERSARCEWEKEKLKWPGWRTSGDKGVTCKCMLWQVLSFMAITCFLVPLALFVAGWPMAEDQTSHLCRLMVLLQCQTLSLGVLLTLAVFVASWGSVQHPEQEARTLGPKPAKAHAKPAALMSIGNFSATPCEVDHRESLNSSESSCYCKCGAVTQGSSRFSTRIGQSLGFSPDLSRSWPDRPDCFSCWIVLELIQG